MHLVHNVLRTRRPSSITRTRCKLGLNLRFVAFIEKLRDCPNVVDLPHRSHLAMNDYPLHHQVCFDPIRVKSYHSLELAFKTRQPDVESRI
jgi:hypothetical protein